MSKHRGFEIAKAVKELSDAKSPGKRMGAALFSGKRLLAVGANRFYKTNPNSLKEKMPISTHAEVAALIKRRHYDNGKLTMYVYREVGGKPACSMPCTNCQLLLKEAGVSKVWYLNKDGQKELMKIP